MAQFTMTLPIQTMREIERLYSNSLEAYEMMTQAGAQVVYDEVKKNMRYAFKEPKKLEPYLRITKPYRSCDGSIVKTKVGFYGYYKKGDKPYINKRTQKGTAAFQYHNGVYHRALQTGGRTEATYEYKQEGVPVPLIVMAREYGTSSGETKKPFFRKSFNKAKITKAMTAIQKEYFPFLEGD